MAELLDPALRDKPHQSAILPDSADFNWKFEQGICATATGKSTFTQGMKGQRSQHRPHRQWRMKCDERAKLYSLDSNDAANYPVRRSITSELCGADLSGIGAAHHLQQCCARKRYVIIDARVSFDGTHGVTRR